MAVMLMKLRNVPEDEADAVRALLEANHVDYYETPPDRWGVSMPAIWLRRDEQAETARALLERFQEQRQREARADYLARRERGEAETLLTRALQTPLRTVVYLAVVAVVLYLTLNPFLTLGS